MAEDTRSREAEEVAEKRQFLAHLIAAHAPKVGAEQLLPPAIVVYEPSLNIYAQGKKQVSLGGKTYVCGGSSYLVSSIDVPVQSQIVEASELKPLLSMLLRLDLPIVRELLTAEDLPDFKTQSRGLGLVAGELTVGLLDVCVRLLSLLDSPSDIPFMSRLIHREIIYRLLCSPQGQRLRAIATSSDLNYRAAKAIAWLKANYRETLRMEQLAETTRLSVSTLHHQFRALTGISPLQFQKHLRLRAARERMLNDGVDATTAAFDVGYESVSQFNREYSRLFGLPPMRDIKALKQTGGAAVLS